VVVVDGSPPVEVAAKTEAAPVKVTLPADGNDTVQVVAKDDDTCKAGAVGHLFQPGGSYHLAIVAGTGTCTASAIPAIEIS
jgi:hypothetical protein